MKYLYHVIKAFASIEFIFLSLILIANLIFITKITGNEQSKICLSSPITSFGAFILIILIIFLLTKAISTLKPSYFLVISQIIYTSLIFLWIKTSTISPFADQASVYNAAINFNENNFEDLFNGGYLFIYNHQIPLTFMFSIVLKLFRGDYKIIEIIIGFCSVGVNLGLYYISKELFNERVARIAVIISMMFIPTILLTIYVYGDIIGLCFSIWAIYFTLRYGKEGKLLHAFYGSILIGIGMLFRFNVIIILIAMIIYILLKSQTKKLLCLLIVFTSLLYSYGIKEYVSFKSGVNLEGGIPSILFINMGLEEGPRSYGWYNSSTLKNYNSSNKDYNEANKLGFELVKDRLSYMSSNPLYTLRFFTTKFITTWAEPTYESIYFTTPNRQNKEVSSYYKNNVFLNSLYYGSLNKLIIIYSKGFVLFTMGGAVLGLYLSRKKTSLEQILMSLSLVGAIIFHLFWETKSRYIFPYIVMIFPIVANFWSASFNKLLKLKKF